VKRDEVLAEGSGTAVRITALDYATRHWSAAPRVARHLALGLLCATALSLHAADYDVLIRRGTVYDGSGRAGVIGDVALSNDTIVAVGNLSGRTGRREIDARGLAVAPGFINMLSWANESLLEDGRSESNIR